MKNFKLTKKKFPMKVPLLRTFIEPWKNKTVRNFLFVSGFSCLYMFSLIKANHSEDEVLRIGAAGSITVLVGESTFYCIDAVNTRSKMLKENVGFKEMASRIIKSEGIYGLYKGYSASFYGTIIYGYLYFFIYKASKIYMKE